jgi:hypothetical protein
MSEPWWLTVGLVVLGAILGAILSIASTLIVEVLKDRKLSQATKKVLAAEISYNQISISDFWTQIQLGIFAGGGNELLNEKTVLNKKQESDLPDLLIYTTLPELKREAFDNLAPILGNVYKSREIIPIFDFYYNLNKFQATRSNLIKLREGEIESHNQKSSPWGLTRGDYLFSKNAPQLGEKAILCHDVILSIADQLRDLLIIGLDPSDDLGLSQKIWGYLKKTDGIARRGK